MKITILVLALSALCGCSRKQDFGCIDQLKTLVPIGTSIADAEAAVKRCGMEYSIDMAAKTLRAVKRGQGSGITQKSRVVLIRFDEFGKVSSVDTRPEFTGP